MKPVAYLIYTSSAPGNGAAYQHFEALVSTARVYVFSQIRFRCPELEERTAGVWLCPGRSLYLDRLLYPLWAVVMVLRLERRLGERVVIYTPPSSLGIIAGYILKKLGRRWAVDIWDDLDKSVTDTRYGWPGGRLGRLAALCYFWILWRLSARCIESADLVVWGLHPNRLKIYRIPGERVLYLTNGVCFDDLPPEAHSPSDGAFRVVYIGSVAPIRAISLLLEAARRLLERGLDCEWWVIGPDHEWFEARVRSIGLTACVKVIGPLTHRETLKRVAQADVGLCLLRPIGDYPYTYPIKLFEYLALGKPVVATDLPGTREIIRDNENGLLIPAENAAALAEALRRLAQDQALRQRLSAQAREDAKQYDWKLLRLRLAERIEELLT